MATTLPVKYEHGDFQAWLCQFECFAVANSWICLGKDRQLPAFLRGITATYFYALSNDQKDSSNSLVPNLKSALCPTVC